MIMKGVSFLFITNGKKNCFERCINSILLGFSVIQKIFLGDVKSGILSCIFAFTFILALDAANMEKLAYMYFTAEQIIDHIKYLRQ